MIETDNVATPQTRWRYVTEEPLSSWKTLPFEICLDLFSFGCIDDEVEIKAFVNVLLPLIGNAAQVVNKQVQPVSRLTRRSQLLNLLNHRKSKLLPSTIDNITNIPFMMSEYEAEENEYNSEPTNNDGVLKCKLYICFIITWVLKYSMDNHRDNLLNWFFQHPPLIEAIQVSGKEQLSSVDDALVPRLWANHDEIQSKYQLLMKDSFFERLTTELDLTRILISFLSCDYAPLVATSLDLIGSYFNAHRELYRCLEDMYIISDSNLYLLHEKIKTRGMVLRLYNETCQIWITNCSDNSSGEVRSILQWLVEVLVTNDDKELLETQQLMRSQGIDELVLSILTCLGNVLLETVRAPANKIHLRFQEHLLDCCCSFFIYYAWNHVDIQYKLSQMLPLWRKLILQHHMSPAMLYVIFRNNLALCRSISEDFIGFVFQMMDESGQVAVYLDILSALIVCNMVPIKENQDIVSKYLMATDRKRHILYVDMTAIPDENTFDSLIGDPKSDLRRVCRKSLFDSEGHKIKNKLLHLTIDHSQDKKIDDYSNNAVNMDNLISLVVQQSSNPSSSTMYNREGDEVKNNSQINPFIELRKIYGSIQLEPSPFLYFARLLDLLVNLTLGQNFTCKARLQGLYRIDSLIQMLEMEKPPIPIKTRLLRVLMKGWINTEQFMTEAANNRQLLHYISTQVNEFGSLIKQGNINPNVSKAAFLKVHGHELEYLFDGLLPLLRYYFSLHYEARTLNKALRKAILVTLNSFDMLSAIFEGTPYGWKDILSPSTLAYINDYIQLVGNYLTLDYSSLIFGATPVISKQIHTKKSPYSGTATFKCFTKWLHSSSFYVSSVENDKLQLMGAFLQKHKTDMLTNENQNHAEVTPILASSGIEFGDIIQKLISHANQCEIRLGHFATHSSIEIITVMEQLSSSSIIAQSMLQSFGAIKMIVELYCKSHEDDFSTHDALIQFGITFLRNGSKDAQADFFAQLKGPNESWFQRTGNKLIQAIASIEFHEKANLLTDSSKITEIFCEDTIKLLELIRLLCEEIGHNVILQNLLRQQQSSRSVNLVQLVVTLFNELVRTIQPNKVLLLKKTFETIIELIQGPCEDNQVAVVEPTARNGCNFMDAINILLSMNDAEPEYQNGDVPNLKRMCTLSLVALLEGRTDIIIHERMASLLSIRFLKESMINSYSNFLIYNDGMYSEDAFDQSFLSIEGRQKENYFIRLIKILLGQYHLPIVMDTDSENIAKGDKKKTRSIIRLLHRTFQRKRPFLNTKETQKESFFMLNSGFDVFILFNRLLEVPNIRSVLENSILPECIRNGDTFCNYMFVNTTMNPSPNPQKKTKLSEPDLLYMEAFNFFGRHCASVEVQISIENGKKRLQRFYFPKPPICTFLTPEMRKSVLESINRDSPPEKIQDLFRRSDSIISKMKHRYLMSFAGDKYFRIGKNISFVFALILNFVLVTCYVDTLDPRFKYISGWPVSKLDQSINMACIGKYVGLDASFIISTIGLMQVLISIFIVLIHAITNGPLVMLEGWKRYALNGNKINTKLNKVLAMKFLRQKVSSFKFSGVHFTDIHLKNIFLSIYFLATNPEYMYYMVYLVMALLGYLYHTFFFAFHLFDVLLRFRELTIIVQAVTKPWKSLVLTFILLMIVEYIFAIIGFTYFRNQYRSVKPAVDTSFQSVADCGMLLSCYFSTLDQTFKNNGGIGAYLEPVTFQDGIIWPARLTFDNVFNIIILLVLVNIWFGIIIDTFGHHRSRMQARKQDILSKCFICNINRETFDRLSHLGFEHHIRSEHYLWNYVFLVAHLRFKSELDYDGVEQYLWRAIQNEDYTFVPLYHAMAIENEITEDNPEKPEFRNSNVVS